MPHLTQSPLSSPSLRSIVQMKTSYFPPVPLAPHSYHGRVPPTPHSSLNIVHHSPQPNLNSNLVGCLKHSQHISNRPSTAQAHGLGNGNQIVSSPLGESPIIEGPYHRGDTSFEESLIKPAMKSMNGNEKRRISTCTTSNNHSSRIKVSQIPIGNTSNSSRGIHTSIQQHAQFRDTIPSHVVESNQAKRRPSFKIELPPRPIQQQPKNVLPGHQQLTPLLSNTPLANANHNHSNTFISPTVFTDPFVNSNAMYEYPAGGYMILRAPTKVPESRSFMDDFPSPTQTYPSNNTHTGGLNADSAESLYGNQGVGLGYSLNKRVATPWLRSKGDEEEWLKNDDLDMMDVENKVRGLAFA